MLELPWPSRSLSPNHRAHWSAIARAKRTARNTACLLARDAKVKPGTALHLIFCPPDNRLRDIDNALASMKASIDGIADAWGVNDRSFRLSMQWGEVYPNGRVIVQVSE